MIQGITKVELDFYAQTPKYFKKIAEELEESNRLKRKEIELLRRLVNGQKTEQVGEQEQE